MSNIDPDTNKRYRFNFRKLELALQASYNTFIEDTTNEKAFVQLFYDIKNIAFGILKIGKVWVNYDLDYDMVAYEYATHLIERIITGKFAANPEKYDADNKFGWHNYIRLNMRDIITRKFPRANENEVSLDELKELFDECEFLNSALVDQEAYRSIERETNVKAIAYRCARYLKMLFGDKYYILSSKLLSTEVGNINEITDPELLEFTKVSLVLFKRLYEYYRLLDTSINGVDKVFNSTLYLASILTNEADQRLYVSLDLSNLYRLAMSYGGETIRVPTVEELEELIGTARISYKILSHNLTDKKKVKKLRNQIREEWGISVRLDKLNANVRNLFKYLATEINDPTGDDIPMLKSLTILTNRSDEIMTKLLDKIDRAVDITDDKTEMMELYRSLINNLNVSFNMVTNICNMAGAVPTPPQSSLPH